MSGKRTKWLRRLVGQDQLRPAKQLWTRLPRNKRHGAAILLKPQGDK